MEGMGSRGGDGRRGEKIEEEMEGWVVEEESV